MHSKTQTKRVIKNKSILFLPNSTKKYHKIKKTKIIPDFFYSDKSLCQIPTNI